MGQVKQAFQSDPSGLPVAMAIGIDNALSLMKQGRVGAARDVLEKSLLHAGVIDPDVNEVISGENRYEYPF